VLQAYRQVIAVAILAATPLLVGATGEGVDFNARLLAAHNSARAAAGIPPLVWNAALAADARKWADALAATGRFDHSPDDPGKPLEGENLWAGTPHAFSPEAMVALWAAEKKDYRPGVFPNNSVSGDVDDVGHYTQMIWRGTHEVGCATAIGHDEQVLVCRYSQPGNVYGERPA
jgi:hypothetical protein